MPQDYISSSSFLQLIIPEQIKDSIIQKQTIPFQYSHLNFLPTQSKQISKVKEEEDTRKPPSTRKVYPPSHLHEFLTVCTFPGSKQNKTGEPHARHWPIKRFLSAKPNVTQK